jgi:hypothetical protein
MYDIGVFDDGRLHNPKGYPEDKVRKALADAEERQRKRRSDGAKKAAVTRKRRQQKLIHEIAKGIAEGRNYGPREHCVLCKRGLTDQESIQRGVGSDCWQGVLSATERMRDHDQRQSVIDGLLT